VTRASVAKLNLQDTFERRNEIAKAVDKELEKVVHSRLLDFNMRDDLNRSSLNFAGYV